MLPVRYYGDVSPSKARYLPTLAKRKGNDTQDVIVYNLDKYFVDAARPSSASLPLATLETLFPGLLYCIPPPAQKKLLLRPHPSFYTPAAEESPTSSSNYTAQLLFSTGHHRPTHRLSAVARCKVTLLRSRTPQLLCWRQKGKGRK